MRILGIDPGLQVCGYACLERTSADEHLVEAGELEHAPQVGRDRHYEVALSLERFGPGLGEYSQVMTGDVFRPGEINGESLSRDLQELPTPLPENLRQDCVDVVGATEPRALEDEVKRQSAGR